MMNQQCAALSIRRYSGGGLLLLIWATSVLMSALVLQPATPAEASGPCDSILDWGGGGTEPTEPTFSGGLEDADSAAPIAGAEVKIFQCKNAGPQHVGTDYSDLNGAYGFVGLDPDFGYYLEIRIGAQLVETSDAHLLDLDEDFVLNLPIDD